MIRSKPLRRAVPVALSLCLAVPLFACSSAGSNGDEPQARSLSAEQKDDERAQLRAMRDQTLKDLYAQRPATRAEIAKAKGYAVVGASGLNLVLLVGAEGGGMIVDQRSGKETFIRMLRAGTGPGLGYMKYRYVLVFKNDTAFDQFLTLGVDVSAQGNATIKPGGVGESTDAMASFTPYVSVYQLMDKGVNVQANWGGTKYFKDPDLN